MQGGAGNDIYFVDDALDVVTESADAGEDVVASSASFVLGASVEQLDLELANDADGTGNELANTILGSDGANVLSGLGGDDRIRGPAAPTRCLAIQATTRSRATTEQTTSTAG